MEQKKKQPLTKRVREFAAAFTEWERRFREDPEKFQSDLERLESSVETQGEACAVYFADLLSEAPFKKGN